MKELSHGKFGCLRGATQPCACKCQNYSTLEYTGETHRETIYLYFLTWSVKSSTFNQCILFSNQKMLLKVTRILKYRFTNYWSSKTKQVLVIPAPKIRPTSPIRHCIKAKQAKQIITISEYIWSMYRNAFGYSKHININAIMLGIAEHRFSLHQ